MAGCAGGADLISMKGSGGSWRVGWRIETLDYERRDDDLVARWKKLEVLYPGDRWVDRRPDNPAYAITAFLVGDANCFGSDIIRKQGHALLAKNKTEYGGSLASIEEAIEIQMFLVVDPRVQQCQQMHAIATSYLGSMYHERFNQTVVAGDLDQALSLYQTAVERSTPQSDIHADCLHRLAEGYRSRYQSASDDDDSGRGITALSEACDSNQKDPGLLLYRVCVLVPWLTEHFERGKSLDPVEKAIPGLFRVLAVIQDDHSNPLFPQVEAFGNFISRFADAVEHKRLEGAFNLGHSSASSGEVPCGDAQISQVVKEMVEDRSSSTLLFASPPPEVSAHIDSNNASLPEKAQIYMDVQAHPSSQIMPGPSVQQVPEASHTPSPELQALQAQRTLDERRIARLEQEVVDLRCLLQKALVAQVVQATTSKKRPRLEEQPDLPPLPSPSLSSLTGLPGFFESALQPATSSKRPRLA
ncbi:hypothetical protein BKA70DRAFT_503609 [Coprinopsis sp. MPI-PUGE-AT-0042]|nr:hypothetical protein BKA70DRAFT_503609 [Coprinopsis sp. MPI-PUGE-AT-0042]